MNRATPEPASAARVSRLEVTLKAVGACFVGFFGLAFALIATGVPVTGTLAALTRWGHGGESYELMITALYVVWGVYLWRAGRDPGAHASFIDFTLAANIVHFGVMLALGLAVEGEHVHMVGDVLWGWVAIVAIAASWLPVRRSLSA